MLLHVGHVILIIFEVLILFNLLIVVHELGHFLAARWRGLYIEQFGIWFGKPLWKKKIKSVDGNRVTRFGGMGDDSISWLIVRSEGDSIPITIARESGGKTETMTVQAKPIVPPTKAWMRKALRQIEILPAETPLVAKVEPDSPAAKAGLQ